MRDAEREQARPKVIARRGVPSGHGRVARACEVIERRRSDRRAEAGRSV